MSEKEDKPVRYHLSFAQMAAALNEGIEPYPLETPTPRFFPILEDRPTGDPDGYERGDESHIMLGSNYRYIGLYGDTVVAVFNPSTVPVWKFLPKITDAKWLNDDELQAMNLVNGILEELKLPFMFFGSHNDGLYVMIAEPDLLPEQDSIQLPLEKGGVELSKDDDGNMILTFEARREEVKYPLGNDRLGNLKGYEDKS